MRSISYLILSCNIVVAFAFCIMLPFNAHVIACLLLFNFLVFFMICTMELLLVLLLTMTFLLIRPCRSCSNETESCFIVVFFEKEFLLFNCFRFAMVSKPFQFFMPHMGPKWSIYLSLSLAYFENKT